MSYANTKTTMRISIQVLTTDSNRCIFNIINYLKLIELLSQNNFMAFLEHRK